MITVPEMFGIEKDEDWKFFDVVRSEIAHADGSAEIRMYKRDNELSVHILPSSQDFRQEIIDALLKTHRSLGLKIIFSKSLKISKRISYICII